MARPKKDESIRRTKNVMVRFTDVEYALVSCSAEQAGYPVAVYVRKQAITEKLHVHYNIVADIAELRDFARQLSHIGNNLNQIAAFFNSGGIQSRAMLEEINRCMTDLRAMRKEIAGLAGDYSRTPICGGSACRDGRCPFPDAGASCVQTDCR